MHGLKCNKQRATSESFMHHKNFTFKERTLFYDGQWPVPLFKALLFLFSGEKNLDGLHKLASQGDRNGIMNFMKVCIQ